MKLKVKIFSILLMLFFAKGLLAQDPIYSQFHITPSMLNPAFVGNSFTPYITSQYRDRWSQHNKAYRTFTTAYNQRYSDNHSFGLLLTSDNALNSILVSNKLAFQYALRIQLDKETFIKGGVELGYVNQNLDHKKLIFYNNLDPIYGGVTEGGSKLPSLERGFFYKNNYYDIGLGFTFNTKDYYVGFSTQHVNRPNGDFKVSDIDERKSMLFSLQGGYRIKNKISNLNNVYLMPTFIVNTQENSWQTQIGVIQSVENMFIGTWYRYATRNSDAFILGAGVNIGIFKFSYSFDYPISRIQLQSFGTHELGVVMKLKRKDRVDKIYDDCFNIFR